MNTVVQILDTIAEETARADRTDGQLLDLFVRLRDQDAFAAVVRRHGPMVLGVCRRILRNLADADDAFQAAFLVLARKAATIGTRELLGQWLYGVAYNTARKLRQSNARRAVREQAIAETVDPHANASEGRGELLAILDDEVARLPDRYRAVIVLCDLEGLTRREVAKLLTCPEGTVAGRLARARDLLAARLTARGVAPAVGLLAAVLTESASLAVSPAAVAGVVRTICVSGLANAAAKGLISQRVAETTEGVLKSMFATKLRVMAAVTACCGLALACAVGAIHFANAQPAPDSLPYPLVDVKAADKPAEKATPKAEKKLPTAIPLKTLEAKPTAAKLQELLPKTVTVVAARDENTLIVYANPKGTEDVRLVLRALGEELPKETARPAEPKKYTFRFKRVPWDEVLDWYAKETGLTMITTVKPTGMFTCEPPAGKQFTLEEITDFLNEAMAQQKLILIRRHLTFYIQSADEKIDPKLIPLIELSELSKRGNSEIVQVILPLKNFTVAFIQDEVKKFLSPFGSLVPLEKQKCLLIQDTVGNINRIREALFVEHPTGPDSLDYVCKWRSAQTMADVLKTLLTDKDTAVTITGTQKDTKNRGRAVLIAVDARRNAILMTAAPDKLALAKKLIAELDKPRNPTDKPFVVPEPILKSYNVPPGSAAEVAKALATEMVWVKVTPLEKQNQIMVLATPDEHLWVAKFIEAKGKNEKPKAKTYNIKFEKTSWKNVFTWYAFESGLTLVGDALPTGTFTFDTNAPPNILEVLHREYTLAEITDYINEALLAQKWLLVRNEKSFAVIPADEKPDPKWVPRIKPEELDRRGKYDLVEVVIPITVFGPDFRPLVPASDVLPTVRRMLSPFGQAKENYYTGWRDDQLLVRDTAGNVAKIVKTIREIEQSESKKRAEKQK